MPTPPTNDCRMPRTKTYEEQSRRTEHRTYYHRNAAEAVAKVWPSVQGKLFGKALRVPVITGSLTDLTCILSRKVTEAEINEAFRKAAEGSMKGIVQYNEVPLVSSDIIGNKHSSIFDAPLTKVTGNLVSVVAWYDNEAGYSARLSDLVMIIARRF
ncbi:hypothetical protein MASR1M65_11630 [Saprospiraceae bacterium]